MYTHNFNGLSGGLKQNREFMIIVARAGEWLLSESEVDGNLTSGKPTGVVPIAVLLWWMNTCSSPARASGLIILRGNSSS